MEEFTDWPERWASHTDEAMRTYIITRGEGLHAARCRSYAETVAGHIRPKAVLDIGGATGEFGRQLTAILGDIDYTIMDHPRMREYAWSGAAFLPIGSEIRHFDLVVNTNSFGETSIDIVRDYFTRIEAAGCSYFYTVNRKNRQVDFAEYPLENWRTLVMRSWPGSDYFCEFLGQARR